VMSNFGMKYWRGYADGCWPYKAGCTNLLGTSYEYTKPSSGTAYCVKVNHGASNARPILRRLTVDTRCHLDNYNRYCDLKRPSNISIGQVDIAPDDIFINLLGGTLGRLAIIPPDYNGPMPDATRSVRLDKVRNLDLLFIHDINNIDSNIFNAIAPNVKAAAKSLQDTLKIYNTNFNKVRVAYRHTNDINPRKPADGRNTIGSVSFIDSDGSANLNVPSSLPTQLATTSIIDVTAALLNTSTLTWTFTHGGDQNYMRIVVIMTANGYSSSNIITTRARLEWARVYPYVYTTTG
jgi:hypothetical protein